MVIPRDKPNSERPEPPIGQSTSTNGEYCSKCGSKLIDAVGIGYFCPNITCKSTNPFSSDNSNAIVDDLIYRINGSINDTDDRCIDERKLREYLWLNHSKDSNCTPYGDDGEMQCCGIDFKRTSIDDIIDQINSLKDAKEKRVLAEDIPTLIYTFDVKKNKYVIAGRYLKGVFTKNVKEKHYMRIFGSYGISLDVITKLFELECHAIRVQKGSKFIEVPFDDWKNLSLRKDVGHGEQYFFKVEKL